MTTSGEGSRPRLRRSCLAVPASNARMIEKAAGLPADMVFLDLEDAVAPGAKDETTRRDAARALARARMVGADARRTGQRGLDPVVPP